MAVLVIETRRTSVKTIVTPVHGTVLISTIWYEMSPVGTDDTGVTEEVTTTLTSIQICVRS